MDRLSALIVAAAALVACNEHEDGTRASGSRVDSVKAGRAAGAAADGVCDVQFADDKAPAFAMPPLAGGALPATGWRWINVWATWCKPCVEEMARLRHWQSRLDAAGHPVTLVFVSADEPDTKVDGPRLADPAALGAWATSLGLDAEATVPIHVLVDPAGRVRCVRAGAVHDPDYAAFESLLRT